MEFKFVGAKDLTEDLFRKCPIWIMYEGLEQDEEMSAWGVNLEKAWGEKIENAENEYYFPYLGDQEPSLGRGTKVYCLVRTRCGIQISGVLVGGFAFSVFFLNRSYMFNRNMPDFGEKISKELCAALGASEEDIFPLTFTPAADCFSGKNIGHCKYW